MIDYTSYARGMAAGVNPDAIVANQGRQQRLIAQHTSDEAQKILSAFQIARDISNSFFSSDGEPLQLAWNVIRKSTPTERCTVIYDGAHWAVVDMQRVSYTIPAYIEAVQVHIAAKKAQRAGETTDQRQSFHQAGQETTIK